MNPAEDCGQPLTEPPIFRVSDRLENFAIHSLGDIVHGE